MTCRRFLQTAFLCLTALLFIAIVRVDPARADIYVYTDENGVSHFTNVPTSTRYKPFIRDRAVTFATGVLPDRYDRLIDKASKAHGVSFHLVKAVIKVESNFNPRAVSRAGALGLMQIMPENLEPLHVSDPFDPFENIMGGTKYLKYLLNRFDGQLSMALAAYNAGPNRVEEHNSIPPFPETRDYVKNVIRYYRLIRNQ